MGQSVKAAQHPPSALPHTHTVNMTHDQVKKIYQGWAETYDDDTAKLKAQGPGADYVVDCLTYALKKGGKNNVSKVTVLDVACGTGIVGVSLQRAGFKSVTGLDFSWEMLDLAQDKGCYNELVESAFGAEVPHQLEGRKFDSVVMKGGFAAGHLPLASLETMAKLCKSGGVVINSMTKHYTEIIPEYKNIEQWIKEKEDEGVWVVEEKREVANYMNGRMGMIHVLRVA